MLSLLYFTLLFCGVCMAKEEKIEAEPEPVVIRVTAWDWYPKPYSLEVSEQIKESEDIRCKLVTSAVKAALMMKQYSYIITKDQLQQAFRHFESCRESLCRNYAMLDQFMKPQTFQEQINILLLQAKILTTPQEEKRDLLRGLINAKYWDDIAGGPFPQYYEDSLHHQQSMVASIIENTCGSQSDDLGKFIRQSDISKVFLHSLVDHYTAGAITERNASDLISSESDVDKTALWDEIADRIFSGNSNFASTCLDPAIAFYDDERPSVTKIREFAAKELNILCEKPPPVMMPKEAAAAPPISYDYDYMMAAPPPSNNGPSGGAPGSPNSVSGGAPSGAPGSPGGGSSFRP